MRWIWLLWIGVAMALSLALLALWRPFRGQISCTPENGVAHNAMMRDL